MPKLEIKIGEGGRKYLAYEMPSPVGETTVPMVFQEHNCSATGVWPLLLEAVELRDRCEHSHGGLLGELATAKRMIECMEASVRNLGESMAQLEKDAEAREADSKEVRQQVASLSAQLDSANEEIATLRAAAEVKTPVLAKKGK